MTELFTDLHTIADSELFASRMEMVKYMMLRLVRQNETGLGAWEIQVSLREAGIELSTATAGRYLKELDNSGLTVKISNKGRVLTQEGRAYMERMDTELMSSYLHKSVKKAAGGSEYKDLFDIYAVRIPIELEAVRLCCRNAAGEEIDEIGRYAESYGHLARDGEDFTNASLDFHVLIAKGTRNHFMAALLGMLIFEQKKIENSLDYLVTRQCGLLFSQQHREIFESIRARDEEKAVRLMQIHFDEIIDAMRQDQNARGLPEKRGKEG